MSEDTQQKLEQVQTLLKRVPSAKSFESPDLARQIGKLITELLDRQPAQNRPPSPPVASGMEAQKNVMGPDLIPAQANPATKLRPVGVDVSSAAMMSPSAVEPEETHPDPLPAVEEG